MARETVKNCISGYITDKEKQEFSDVEKFIDTSKAEFIRMAVMKEVRRVRKLNKKV